MRKQRHRRNPQTCVLCKTEETYDWDHICYDCRQAWRLGYNQQQAGQTKPPDGLVDANIAWYWYLYHFAGNPDKTRDAKKDLVHDLLTLVGARQHEHSSSNSHAWAIGYPKDYNQGGISQSRYTLHGNQSTLDLLQQIYENICHLLADAYKDGHRKGKSLVIALAENKLSVKDLERF